MEASFGSRESWIIGEIKAKVKTDAAGRERPQSRRSDFTFTGRRKKVVTL
jgi:hypothetical protein